MSLQRFISEAISPWMKSGPGPEGDIVLSTRIRLARNLEHYPFPIVASDESANTMLHYTSKELTKDSYPQMGSLELLKMNELSPNQKRVLVEKHLISPHLAEKSLHGAVLLSDDESVSIMLNEEDHIRLQCLFRGFQLNESLVLSNGLDDWIEEKVTYAFDEKRGFLTSCPTNVGTGMRASVMMHLPALVMTQQLNRILPAINQLGLVVRGIYGEGSEALGNLFQISNQMTLGKSEEDIVEDLRGVVMQLIQQERYARDEIMRTSKIQLEDKVFRSFGLLTNSRIMESKEAAERLSDVRLGIDLDLIQGISGNILNELMILTQPGFLQQYAGKGLTPDERDVRRAALIRERMKLEREG
ncbi:protein arginine kinase [Alteribacillus persepolensis]|uniref:Protein-arginine kinase n=1 Tax=Alteribacillus persepolensis TaxID=568899 RepID=A0A1G8HH74_9BACI|nr:protein arginine kinase [Alteribacillus persepolensis]SDI06006.1 protein arginine kinase [Alteribacillus persepolensis]